MTKLRKYVSAYYTLRIRGDLHNDVDKVKLPSKLLQTKGIDPLVKDPRQSGKAETQRKTLSTNVIWQNFHCVRDSQARPGSTGDTVEQEDHGDHGNTSRGRFCLGVDGTAGGPNAERDEHSDASEEEQDSSSYTVDEEGGAEGDQPAPDCEATVDVSLSDCTISLALLYVRRGAVVLTQ